MVRAREWIASSLLAVACGAPEPAAEGTPAPAALDTPSRATVPLRATVPRRQSAGPSDGADLVKLELLADVTRVAPGGELTLAARFDLAPEWHVYWINPGEAGLATEARFTAPPGFTVGPVRFPGPVRFDSPGEVASYGYSVRTVLSAQVKTPGAIADRRPQRFEVSASWLACKDVCIRGEGAASLELPLATRAEPSQPANPDLFAAHREELPRPMTELGASHRWERDARQVRLVVEARGAERIEYFPPTSEDLTLTGQSSAGGVLRLIYKPGDRPARSGGVLAVTRGGQKRYYAVDLTEEVEKR